MDCAPRHPGFSSGVIKQKVLQTSFLKKSKKERRVCWLCRLPQVCHFPSSRLFFFEMYFAFVFIFFCYALVFWLLAGRINHQDFTLSLGDLIQRQQRFVLWWQVKRPTHRGANRRSNGPPLHGAARPEIHSALLNKYFQDRLHR